MELKLFQESFRNKEINIKPYILVVSIFIGIILIIMSFNSKIEDYYITEGIIKNKEVKIVTDISNLNNIINNKKIKIEKDIFTYEVKKIDDYIDNNMYKEVTISIKKYNNLIDNNVVKLKIIINKTNILNYLIKTLKGE